MPFGDRTGPVGFGPMTGRRGVFCAGFTAPGYVNSFLGQGFGGRGRGCGHGWRHWYHATGLPGWQRLAAFHPAWERGWPCAEPAVAPLAREQEIEVLKGQTEYLEQTLEGIRKRVEELQVKGMQP